MLSLSPRFEVKEDSMKVLSLNGYFHLPDDFNGTLPDAIRLLADYHESKEARKQRIVGPDTMGVPPDLWSRFWNGAQQGFRVCMGMALGEWHKDRGWTRWTKPGE